MCFLKLVFCWGDRSNKPSSWHITHGFILVFYYLFIYFFEVIFISLFDRERDRQSTGGGSGRGRSREPYLGLDASTPGS